jgi:hypothetical protein
VRRSTDEVVGHDESSEPDDPHSAPAAVRLWDRRAVFGPFAVAGAVSVFAGGLLAAAIAAPAPTRHGVWAIAYLVLVSGVSQIVLGAGQALLASKPPGAHWVTVTAVAFNVGNAAVVAGVVTERIVVFDVGSLLLAAALVLFLYGVRRGARRGWLLFTYRLLVALLVVSIPIGMFVTTVGPR